MLLLLAEPEEGVDAGPAMSAADPGNRCTPLELRDLGRVGQGLADAEQRVDVDAVVDRSVHHGHELPHSLVIGSSGEPVRILCRSEVA